MTKHNSIKASIILLLVLLQSILWTGKVQAQNAISLPEAIQIGLANHYDIKIVAEEQRIAKLNNHVGETGLLPSIDFNLSQNNYVRNVNNPTAFANGNYTNLGYNASVDLSWTLFDGFKAHINKKRLEQLEQESKGNAQLVVENTIHQIINAYYLSVKEKEVLLIIQQVTDISRNRFLEEARKKVYGVSSNFEVLQFENAFLADSSSFIIQQNTYDAALMQLCMAMGKNDGRSITVAERLNYKHQSYAYENLKHQMISNNHLVKNQYIQLQLLKQNQEIQANNRYPNLSLQTGIGRGGYNVQFKEQPSTKGSDFNVYLQFNLSFNLYNGGQVNRAIERAAIEEKIGNLNLEKIKQQMSMELKQTLLTYNNQLQIVQLNQKIIDNAKKNLALAEARYKSGLSSFLDYRSIQETYIEAVNIKLNSVLSLKNTETMLTRLVGGMSEYRF